MTIINNTSWLSSLLNYNPFTSNDDAASEAEQMFTNGVVWSLFPAYIELFEDSVEGKFVLSAFALGLIEQFAENRITVANPVVRRFVPLITTASVIGGTLLTLTRIDSGEYATVAAITSICSLTLAIIKSTTNKPYPPIARKIASYLPIVGHHFKEKVKLF